MVKLLLRIKQFIMAAGLPGVLLLFFPIIILIVTRRRVLTEATTVDASSTVQIVFIGLCSLVLTHFLFRNSKVLITKILFNSPLVFFLLYIILCFFSAFWSPNSFLTLYRSLECLVFLVLIVVVLSNLVQRYSLDTIILWSIYFAFWNLIIDMFYRFKITGFNPFTLPFRPSRLFFPLFFFLILFLGKKTLPKLLSVVVSILGFSNKIFFGVALGFLSFLLGDIKNKLLFFLVIILLGFLIAYIGVDELLLNTVFYGRDSVGIEDSSGRNYVWNYLIEKGQEKPILGFGFAAGELFLLSNALFDGAINAHNSFVSAFVNIGIIGVILILLFFVGVFKLVISYKFPKEKWKPALIGSVIMVFVVSMAAPGIGSRVYGSWIPSIYIIVLVIALKFKFQYLKSNLKSY